jgi:hypothetical protein
VVGTSETGKPDIFERRKTTFRDSRGRTTGSAETGKADIFGKKTTKVQGKTPLHKPSAK